MPHYLVLDYLYMFSLLCLITISRATAALY